MTITLSALLVTVFISAAFIAASWYIVCRQMRPESTPVKMHVTLRDVHVDVGQPDLDARKSAWRRENGAAPVEYVRDRLTESSHEVDVPTLYAESSVTLPLTGDDGERRRCSLCLN